MNDRDIANRITEKLGRKPRNLRYYVEVYKIYHKEPFLSKKEALLKSTLSSSTFFRICKDLEEAGILGERRNFRSFWMPEHVTAGRLPTERWEFTHLVVYLTKFQDEEHVPPYGLTKAEILEKYQKESRTADFLWAEDLVFGILERIAICYLISNRDNLGPFHNFVGQLNPPSKLPEIPQPL